MIPDGDDACGKDQVEVKGAGTHYCACGPGFVIDEDLLGCRACGENEESNGVDCVCKPGYARPSDGEACAETSLGAACASHADCAGEAAVCVLDGTDSYCSSAGCSSSSDCQPTWFCDQEEADSFCKKPPLGYRQMCEGPDDCAGTSATYCDSFQSHSCLIQGCGSGSPCPGDWSCCDISLIGVSLCIEPSGLTDGLCPAGGTLVKP